MKLWVIVWLVCCSQLVCCFQVAPGCSLTGSVSPGGTKGTCTQGRKRTPRLCKPSLPECWGLDSKPCGCTAILDKMEGEPCECPTMEDGSTLCISILDDESPESSATLELDKVVG